MKLRRVLLIAFCILIFLPCLSCGKNKTTTMAQQDIIIVPVLAHAVVSLPEGGQVSGEVVRFDFTKNGREPVTIYMTTAQDGTEYAKTSYPLSPGDKIEVTASLPTVNINEAMQKIADEFTIMPVTQTIYYSDLVVGADDHSWYPYFELKLEPAIPGSDG